MSSCVINDDKENRDAKHPGFLYLTATFAFFLK